MLMGLFNTKKMYKCESPIIQTSEIIKKINNIIEINKREKINFQILKKYMPCLCDDVINIIISYLSNKIILTMNDTFRKIKYMNHFFMLNEKPCFDMQVVWNDDEITLFENNIVITSKNYHPLTNLWHSGHSNNSRNNYPKNKNNDSLINRNYYIKNKTDFLLLNINFYTNHYEICANHISLHINMRNIMLNNKLVKRIVFIKII